MNSSGRAAGGVTVTSNLLFPNGVVLYYLLIHVFIYKETKGLHKNKLANIEHV